MEWININEQQPEEECIAIGYQNLMMIGFVGEETHGGFTCEFDGTELTDVTHWMPLPEPPKTQQ